MKVKSMFLSLIFSLFICWQSVFCATVYVDSTRTGGADDGTSWADAYLTLAQGLTGAGASGMVYVAAGGGGTGTDHAEVSAAANITLLGSAAGTPVTILAVDNSSDPVTPTVVVSGRAKVSMTQVSSARVVGFNGYAYCYGIIFESHGLFRTANTSQDNWWILDNCRLDMPSTASSTARGILLGASSNRTFGLELIDTDIDFAHTTRAIRFLGGSFLWKGGSFIGTAVPDDFIETTGVARAGVKVLIQDVDLSALTSDLTDLNASDGTPVDIVLERCETASGLTVISTALQSSNQSVKLHRCDNANLTYQFQEEYYYGVNTEDIAVYLNATDGTVPISIKMVSNANTDEFITALASPPITAWTDSTGSTVFTMEVVLDSATTINDDDVWMELQYPGGDAQGLLVHDKTGVTMSGAHGTDRVSNALATPAAQTSSSESWTGTGGFTNEQKFKLSVQVTPGKAGPVTARIYLAIPSTTIYIDPYITES